MENTKKVILDCNNFVYFVNNKQTNFMIYNKSKNIDISEVQDYCHLIIEKLIKCYWKIVEHKYDNNIHIANQAGDLFYDLKKLIKQNLLSEAIELIKKTKNSKYKDFSKFFTLTVKNGNFNNTLINFKESHIESLFEYYNN